MVFLFDGGLLCVCWGRGVFYILEPVSIIFLHVASPFKGDAGVNTLR